MVPLVIKEPVRLSAEEPLEVESHRRRGSASSTKKHFFSEGEGSTVRTAASGGLGLGTGLTGLGLAGSANLSASSFEREAKFTQGDAMKWAHTQKSICIPAFNTPQHILGEHFMHVGSATV